jgi:hypothetical protein
VKLTKKGKITHTVTLSGKDIIDMLHERGTDYSPGPDATVKFKVASGGNCSNTDIYFLDEGRVVVTWTKATGDE